MRRSSVRRRRRSAMSICSRRCCTTIWRNWSMTASSGGRWCCRSLLRFEALRHRRQANHEAGAVGSSVALAGGLDLDRAAVGLGHRADDRKTQAEGAAAVAGAADETLEEGLAQVLGHARAVVFDDQAGLAVTVQAA